MNDSIKLILFDLGGVLVELAGGDRMLELTRPAMSKDELWSRWFSSSAVTEFETGRSSPDEFAVNIIDEFQLMVSPSDLLEEIEQWVPRAWRGAADLLKELSESFVLATLSNTNILHWNRIRDQMGIVKHFKFTFASCDTGVMKPDPAAYRNVVQATGYQPENILFLDDFDHNVSGALAVGMQAHRVNGVEGVRKKLSDIGCLEAESKAHGAWR